MKTVYLAGQRSFSNRGCEAIVRSTVELLRAQFGDIEVLVPSDDIARDQRQWQDASHTGVRFVPAFIPRYAGCWVHFQRLPVPALKRAAWPFPMPGWLRDQIESVDAVLSIGGDNYSLDYRIPSPLMGVDAFAQRLGKPIILWGASVGPFEREPHFVPTIRQHLSQFNLICVRESISYKYLTEELVLTNVWQMVDPAFALSKIAVNPNIFWPSRAPNGVLGLNVSPLIERYKFAHQDLRAEVGAFVRRVVSEYGLGVILIPHVVPLNGEEKNNDATYMMPLLDICSDLGGTVTMMPTEFNAAQIKSAISGLRFFIGARTHATIAALSTGVPTISIAYSVKARGINKDLFGHEDVVLPIQSVSADTLTGALNYLLEHEVKLRITLSQEMPRYQTTLMSTMERLQRVVHA